MRYLGFLAPLALGALAAPAAAQRPTRDSLVRIDVRSRGDLPADLADQIERIARTIIEKRALQEQLTRRFQLEFTRIHGDSGFAMPDTGARIRQRRDLAVQLNGVSRSLGEMRQHLRSLCSSGSRPEGWVGVTFQGNRDVHARPSDALRFDDYPEILAVEPGSPAERAGLTAGDTVMSMDDRDVRSRDFRLNAALKAGSRLPIRVKRDGRVREVSVTVGRRPDTYEPECHWIDAPIAIALADMPIGFRYEFTVPDPTDAPGGGRTIVVRPPMPAFAPRVRAAVPDPGDPMPSVAPFPPLPPIAAPLIEDDARVIAGAELARLDDAWRDAMGVDEGVIVLRVSRASPADRAGLRNGDVIVQADDRRLTSPRSLARAVNEATDRQVKLQVVRRKKPMTVMLRW